MKTSFTISNVALLTLALISGSSASAGELRLLGAVQYSYADAVSANGQVVGGHDPLSYWYWTAPTGVVRLIGETISPGNGVGGRANLTDDGTRMTVSRLVNINGVNKAEANIYTIATNEYVSIGSFGFNCDAERSGAWGMSGDGSTIVGLAWENGCAARGFSWRAGTGVTSLGTLYFYKPTRANACNNNGDVIAGWNDDYNGWRQGARWVYNGTTYVEKLLTSDIAGATGGVKLPEANAVSGDGTWVGGLGRSGLDGGAPWRWSTATGYQSLGAQPIAGTGGVTDLNNDGTKALCYMGFAAAYGEGYIWISGRGYVELETYAGEFGVAIPDGVRLSLPLAFSQDELTIVGTARGSFGTSPFVLDLRTSSPPCDADINNDQVVSGLDLTEVLSGWGGCPGLGGCPADINNDQTVDGLDLTVILSTWGPCL